MSNIHRPIVLIVMDGFGLNPEIKGNAVAAARKPNYDSYLSKYQHTIIETSGLAVGLPTGQMGNSEVGHLNLGAGRVVYQEVTRIDKSISDGDFFINKAFIDLIDRVKSNSGKLHLMGLASDGLVHSSLKHLYALMELSKRRGLKDVIIHCFLDGRDTSPTSGTGFIEQISEKCRSIGVGKLGSIVGRYYAMDRDKRWERIKKAYDLIVHSRGLISGDPIKSMEEYYSKNITDEFMEPIAVKGFDHSLSINDGIIFYNFRADRARELSRTLTDPGFNGFDREGGPIVPLVSMTLYDISLNAAIAYPQHHLNDLFGGLISQHSFSQLRTAETEKYPHVTFFFNGGDEKSFPREDRIMIPSPKVATYDLMPEMSAYQLTDSTIEKIKQRAYDVIIMNYANCDMVGHTGIFEAARKAVETVDICIGKIVEAIRESGGVAMITADHGNSEKMIDDDGKPFTAHTTFPVPFILVDDNFKGRLRKKGVLADVAPTMLEYLQISKPQVMTGQHLFA